MVVGMHLDVGGADVNLVTGILQTMIMCLSPIVSTRTEPLCTVVQWTEPEETVSQRLLPLTMPLVMTNHLLFLDEDMEVAVDAVVVFLIAEIQTVFAAALVPIVVPFEILGVIWEQMFGGCIRVQVRVVVH